MKLQHHVRYRESRSEPLTPEYEAEVARTMANAELAWRRAERKLAKAERDLSRARKKAPRAKGLRPQLAELEAIVVRRRQELADLHRLMTETSAPATARGVKSHRHVSTGRVL